MSTHPRGAGIGLEITDSRIYGVRLQPDAPGRVAAWSETPIVTAAGETVNDGLNRCLAELGAAGQPVHIAWFPETASIVATDITGWDPTKVNQLRHDIAAKRSVRTTLEMASNARRYLLAIDIDQNELTDLQRNAERAAGSKVVVEPAPLAAARVAGSDTLVIERGVGDVRWSAALIDGVVALAAGGPGEDIISWTTFERTADDLRSDLDPYPTETSPRDTLTRVSGATTTTYTSVSAELSVRLLGDPYPDYPANDIRFRDRSVVAIGAALAAAGLTGRVQTLNVTVPTSDAPPEWALPWAVQPLTAPVVTTTRAALPWWQRFWNWLQGRPGPDHNTGSTAATVGSATQSATPQFAPPSAIPVPPRAPGQPGEIQTMPVPPPTSPAPPGQPQDWPPS